MNMKTELEVTGMNCQHCVSAVRNALAGVPGVDAVEVSLERAQAVVTGKAEAAAMVAAVEEAGFDAAVRQAD